MRLTDEQTKHIVKLTHLLTNITEVHQTVLADIHARSLLWQFDFHMYWSIFCTHCKVWWHAARSVRSSQHVVIVLITTAHHKTITTYLSIHCMHFSSVNTTATKSPINQVDKDTKKNRNKSTDYIINFVQIKLTQKYVLHKINYACISSIKPTHTHTHLSLFQSMKLVCEMAGQVWKCCRAPVATATTSQLT